MLSNIKGQQRNKTKSITLLLGEQDIMNDEGITLRSSASIFAKHVSVLNEFPVSLPATGYT